MSSAEAGMRERFPSQWNLHYCDSWKSQCAKTEQDWLKNHETVLSVNSSGIICGFWNVEFYMQYQLLSWEGLMLPATSSLTKM